MNHLKADLRQAIRGFRKSPGFAVVIILTLALGIGANSAIFSIVRGVLLSPLPYGEPDRLMFIWNHFPSTGDAEAAVTRFLRQHAGTDIRLVLPLPWGSATHRH